MLTIKIKVRNIESARQIIESHKFINHDYRIKVEDGFGYIPIKDDIAQEELDSVINEVNQTTDEISNEINPRIDYISTLIDQHIDDVNEKIDLISTNVSSIEVKLDQIDNVSADINELSDDVSAIYDELDQVDDILSGNIRPQLDEISSLIEQSFDRVYDKINDLSSEISGYDSGLVDRINEISTNLGSISASIKTISSNVGELSAGDFISGDTVAKDLKRLDGCISVIANEIYLATDEISNEINPRIDYISTLVSAQTKKIAEIPDSISGYADLENRVSNLELELSGVLSALQIINGTE